MRRKSRKLLLKLTAVARRTLSFLLAHNDCFKLVAAAFANVLENRHFEITPCPTSTAVGSSCCALIRMQRGTLDTF